MILKGDRFIIHIIILIIKMRLTTLKSEVKMEKKKMYNNKENEVMSARSCRKHYDTKAINKYTC